MSWLLFMDESGHDHKQTPYEVRGGVAIHAGRLWPFIQSVQRLELDCFGAVLSLYQKELKGSTLLNKKRFRFAGQDSPMLDEARRKHCRSFLTKGLEKKAPIRDEFTAYGQACLEMAKGVFQLLLDHEAFLFASMIPRGIQKPDNNQAEEFLRKDHVFLFERFFYLLEEKQQHGILVMDEVDKTEDRRFVRRMERYFTKTDNGRYRASWIVPTPVFVSSATSYAIQAADLCIYCVNWGFRLPMLGIDAEKRDEIATTFGPWLNRLQFCSQVHKDGGVFNSFGIVFVPDPYAAR